MKKTKRDFNLEKYGIPKSVRMMPELITKVEAAAKKENRNFSNYIVNLLEMHLS